MEGGNPHPSCRSSEKALHTLPHLVSGFVGEGDCKDVPRGHPLLLNEVCDPVRQHPCLSASRPGKDEQWPFRFQAGLLLNRVEIINKRHLGFGLRNFNLGFRHLKPSILLVTEGWGVRGKQFRVLTTCAFTLS